MEIWGPWIEWAGGECPIPDAKDGEWERRNREGIEFGPSKMRAETSLCWDHTGSSADIVAYRTQARLEDLIGKRVEMEFMDGVKETRMLGEVLRGVIEREIGHCIRSISAVADEPKTNTCAPLILQGPLDAPARVHVGTWEPAKPPKCVRFVEVRDGDTGELLERVEGDNPVVPMRAEWLGRNTVASVGVMAVDEPTKPEEPKPAPEGWKLVKTEGRNETWEKRDGDRVERVFKFNEGCGDFECSTDGVTPRDVPGMHAAAMREIEGHIPEPAEPTREAPPLPIAGFDHRLGMWK